MPEVLIFDFPEKFLIKDNMVGFTYWNPLYDNEKVIIPAIDKNYSCVIMGSTNNLGVRFQVLMQYYNETGIKIPIIIVVMNTYPQLEVEFRRVLSKICKNYPYRVVYNTGDIMCTIWEQAFIGENMKQMWLACICYDDLGEKRNDDQRQSNLNDVERELESIRTRNEQQMIDFTKDMQQQMNDIGMGFRKQVEDIELRLNNKFDHFDTLMCQDGDVIHEIDNENKELRAKIVELKRRVVEADSKNAELGTKVKEMERRVPNIYMSQDQRLQDAYRKILNFENMLEKVFLKMASVERSIEEVSKKEEEVIKKMDGIRETVEKVEEFNGEFVSVKKVNKLEDQLIKANFEKITTSEQLIDMQRKVLELESELAAFNESNELVELRALVIKLENELVDLNERGNNTDEKLMQSYVDGTETEKKLIGTEEKLAQSRNQLLETQKYLMEIQKQLVASQNMLLGYQQ